MSVILATNFTPADYARHTIRHHAWYAEQKRLYLGVEPEDGTWAALAVIATPIGVITNAAMLGGGIFFMYCFWWRWCWDCNYSNITRANNYIWFIKIISR